MKINRWATFAAGCGIMASAGLSYAFSIISPGIKDQFGFSDYQIALLASVVNGGAYFALVAGSLYDSLAHRHNLGPRLVIWVGCILMFVGYGGMWAQARGVLQPSFYRMVLCAFLAGNAATFWDVAVLVTNVRNFPHDRGSVLGICKSFLGMSTSIYASVYWALFSGSISTLPPPASLPPPSKDFQRCSISRGLLAQTATVSHSQDGMPSFTGGSRSVAESATQFLGCLALVPTGINLIASAFVNHVPIDYHGLEQLPYEPELQRAPSLKAQPSAALWWCLGLLRVQKSTRFTGMYCLVGVLVIFQAGAALHKGTHQEGREVQKAQMAILLGMLSLLLLLPLSTGPLAVKSVHRAMRMGLHHSRHASSGTRADHAPFLPPSMHPTSPPHPNHALPCAAPTQTYPSQDHKDSSLKGSTSTAFNGDHCHDHGSTGDRIAVAPHPARSASAGGANAAEIGQRGEEGECLLVGSQQHGFAGARGGVRGRHCASASPGLVEGLDADEERALMQREEWTQVNSPGQHGKDVAPAADMPLGKALCQLSFAVLFLQFLSACASGLTYLNNLAALVTSIGGHVGGQIVFVSLFSIANACGRLLFGHVSEHYLHTMGVPRTAFLAIAAVLSLSGSAALAVGAPLSSQYAVSLLMGFAFGGHWSVVPAVASDIYGLSSFAALYAVLQLASALAAFVFASWLAAHFAAAAAAATAAAAQTPPPPLLNLAIASKVADALPAHGRALAASGTAAIPFVGAHAAGVGEHECMGYKCYTPTFRVLVLLHVVSLCGVAWLCQSTKAQYAVIVAGRKQQQQQQQQQPERGSQEANP